MREIWKEKYRRIFKDEGMTVTSLTSKVKANIIELMNNNLRNIVKEEGTFIDWDVEMKKRWNHLINPPLIYPKSKKVARIDCKWELPPT